MARRTSESCYAGSAGGWPAVWRDGSCGAFEGSASCDLLLKSQRWKGHDPTGRLAPIRAQDSQRRMVAWLRNAGRVYYTSLFFSWNDRGYFNTAKKVTLFQLTQFYESWFLCKITKNYWFEIPCFTFTVWSKGWRPEEL